eukprot:4015690-Alexandrium_andersonii.AAC.1
MAIVARRALSMTPHERHITRGRTPKEFKRARAAVQSPLNTATRRPAGPLRQRQTDPKGSSER